MRAVRCIDHQVSVVEVPEPAGEGVVVSIVSAGICGSDLHMVDIMPTAATLGHEFAGLLPDGRLVAVEPLGACRQCADCLDGRPYHCRHGLQMFGSVGDGGMADRCLVPEASLVLMPAGVPPADSSLVEPIAVAVHAVRLAGNLRDARAAIIGGGTIGLCLVAALQGEGITAIDVLARHDHQRAAIQRLGARVGELARSRWDVVFDAVGTAESLAQAIRMTRPGGRVVLVGVYWDGSVPLPAMELCTKEITMIASLMYGHSPADIHGDSSTVRDFDVAAKLLATRPEIGATLITHRFPLDAAAEAFAVARDRASGSIKVVLEP